MNNFSLKDASNIAELLQGVVQHVEDEERKKELHSKVLLLQEAAKNSIDINSEIVSDLAYNVEFLLVFCLKSNDKKYLKSVNNLLKDYKNVDGFDIDEIINDKIHSQISTELIISKVMDESLYVKKTDKAIYYESIEGIIGCSGRNKDNHPIGFAIDNNKVDFINQYKQIVPLNEINKEIKPKQFHKLQQMEQIAQRSLLSGFSPQDFNLATIPVVGLAMLATIFLLKKQYKKNSSAQEYVDKAENISRQNTHKNNPNHKKKNLQKRATISQELTAVIEKERKTLPSVVEIKKIQEASPLLAQLSAKAIEHIEEHEKNKTTVKNVSKTNSCKKKKKSSKTSRFSSENTSTTETERETVPSVVEIKKLQEFSPLFTPSLAKPIEPVEEMYLNNAKANETVLRMTDEIHDMKTQEIDSLRVSLGESEQRAKQAEKEVTDLKKEIKSLKTFVEIVKTNDEKTPNYRLQELQNPEIQVAFSQGVDHCYAIMQTQSMSIAQQAYNDGVGMGIAMAQEQSFQAIQHAYFDGYSVASEQVQKNTYHQGFNDGFFKAVQIQPEKSVKVLKEQININTTSDEALRNIEKQSSHCDSVVKSRQMDRSHSM